MNPSFSGQVALIAQEGGAHRTQDALVVADDENQGSFRAQAHHLP